MYVFVYIHICEYIYTHTSIYTPMQIQKKICIYKGFYDILVNGKTQTRSHDLIKKKLLY